MLLYKDFNLLIYIIIILLLHNNNNQVICSNTNVNIRNLLQSSLNETNNILTTISNRWQINQFPNFLQSVIMSKTAWEVLKLKYQSKILKSLLLLTNTTYSNNKSINKIKFVISFMGSSVTAGHDTPFNQSFAILVKPLIEKPFNILNIDIITRNAAIGNNPCIPYDLCIRTHAGSDSDIIHWEQAYNCHGDDDTKIYVFEQFIRQSNALNTNPIVIFSDSIIPNWTKESCENISSTKLPHLNELDKELIDILNKDPSRIPTEINRRNIPSIWRSLHNLISAYKVSGIQLWTHRFYEVYQCMGPYIDTWGCCSAGWHPSILGHELVASHYTYFWLLIYKDALESLLGIDSNTIYSKYQQIEKHIDGEHKHLPQSQIYPTNYTDNIQCYTTFQPINDYKGDLQNLVLNNPFDHNPCFGSIIYENIDKPDIIERANRQGYLDYKYILYGNMSSSPLSLHVIVNNHGRIYICQPPSDWGEHPKGFRNLWDVHTFIYITIYNKSGIYITNKSFVFDTANAMKIDYILRNPEDVLESLCIELLYEFTIGEYILTIVPTTHDNIMISYLLVP